VVRSKFIVAEVALLACLSLASCSRPGPDSLGDGGTASDGGKDAGPILGFGGTGSSVGGLYINAAVGIAFIDPPMSTMRYESPVDGLIGVQQGKGRSAQSVKDAQLTFNGVSVPPTSLGNFYVYRAHLPGGPDDEE
jgi:hypothetical protein